MRNLILPLSQSYFMRSMLKQLKFNWRIIAKPQYRESSDSIKNHFICLVIYLYKTPFYTNVIY